MPLPLSAIDLARHASASLALAPCMRPRAATRLYWALAGRARGRTNRENMRATLQRIRAATEGRAD